MNCLRCQAQNEDSARFCEECGARLELPCPSCGEPVGVGKKFCRSCGAALAPEPGRFASPKSYTPKHLAEKILTSKNVLEGERKQVTVLFCDIANSTVLAERVGPEAMHGLLEQFFELALTEIHRYEGTVNQFLGDGFMALFGAPVAHEDDARRAVLAALEMQRRVREHWSALQAGPADALSVRMGLNTGLVVVGKIGDNLRMDYTAVGDTTNLAARLQQLADPGTILISEATHRLVQGAVRVEKTEPLHLKGKDEPIVAYKLVGFGPRRSPLEERLTRAVVPFVGRERELAALRDLLAQVTVGQGQVVGVVGEPGMGKSRLLYEFRQTLVGKPLTYLEGRCVSYGSSIPYLPWLDILRNNCGIVDSDSPEAIADKVAFGLHEVGMDPEEWSMYLLHLLGVKERTERLEALSPEAIKARTFEALRQLSLRGSRRRPIIFLVEDAHWIDRTSEEYLATLVESLIAAPIFLITTYRPGYRPPWMDRSYATQITLRRLTVTDSTAVIRSILKTDTVPVSISETILNKAEGNPFFLEELSRALVEHGGAADRAIPDTVQGVIMGRIDRLSDETKRLLRTASVLGREFSLKLLGRIWDGGALEPQLLELRRLEFIYERTGAEEPVYVFKHALTQDVAYEGLLTRRREALHAAAAKALEEIYADRLDEAVDSLAYHYARSEVADKAVMYLIRVADKAARVYANAEAMAHLREALVHLDRLPDNRERDRMFLEVALRQGYSCYFLGRFEESVDLLLQQRERLERLQEPSLTGPYHFWLAHMYSRLGNQERAVDSAQRAIDEATRCADEATLGKAHGLLALEGHWSGRAAEGIEHGQQAVSLLERSGQHWWLGMAHFYVAVNYLLLGRFELALNASAQAQAVGERIADPRLQSYAAFVDSWTEASRGEWETAIDECQRSRKLAPDPVSSAYASAWLGYAYVEKGDFVEALPVLHQAIRELERFGFPQWHGLFTVVLAEAYRLNGQVERALELANQGLKITTRAKYWYGVGFGHRALGRIALAKSALNEAEMRLTGALQTFAGIEAQFEAGRTRLDLAAVAHTHGNREIARTQLKEAYRLFRALEVPRYVERTEQLARQLGIDLS